MWRKAKKSAQEKQESKDKKAKVNDKIPDEFHQPDSQKAYDKLADPSYDQSSKFGRF